MRIPASRFSKQLFFVSGFLTVVPILPAVAQDAPKRMFTIPEDGAGEVTIRPPKVVREILAKRPLEDLTICVAGCRPNRDLVVYAQPSDPADPPKPKENAAAPAPAPAAKSAEQKKPAIVPAGEMLPTAAKSETGGDDKVSDKVDVPAEADIATPDAAAPKAEMKPDAKADEATNNETEAHSDDVKADAANSDAAKSAEMPAEDASTGNAKSPDVINAGSSNESADPQPSDAKSDDAAASDGAAAMDAADKKPATLAAPGGEGGVLEPTVDLPKGAMPGEHSAGEAPAVPETKPATDE